MCYYVQNNHFCTSGDKCEGHYLLASINCQIVSREKMEIATAAVNKSLFDYAEAACQSFLIHLGSSCCISPHSTGGGGWGGQMIWCRGGGWRRRRRTCRDVCEVEWADMADSLIPSPHAGGFTPSEEHRTPKVPADNPTRPPTHPHHPSQEPIQEEACERFTFNLLSCLQPNVFES